MKIPWQLSLCLLTLAATACGPSIQVDTPAEFQVTQRDEDEGAMVDIEGSITGTAGLVEMSVIMSPQDSTAWVPLTVEPGDGLLRFKGSLRLAQGGWYQLHLRMDGGRPTTVVQRFGIGDLFIMAGQSNSTNTGSTRQAGLNDRVSMFDGERWWRAADPMVGVQDQSRTGSPWPRFGDLIQRNTGVPVGLAAVGHGNTLVADWHPVAPPVSGHLEGSRYPELRRRLQALGGARAILWHQGESDAASGTASEAYVEDFKALRSSLERDTGVQVPWVVARASFLPGVDPTDMAAVVRAQETLWREGLALKGPSTDGMQGNLRAPDGAHFSSSGLQVHGERWYAAVWEALYEGPARLPD
jgi:hypothetical protein